jgi:5'-3' exonuclease
MYIDRRWLLLLAIAGIAAAGAAGVAKSRRRRQRAARDAEHSASVRSWKNEGGNLTSTPSAPPFP